MTKRLPIEWDLPPLTTEQGTVDRPVKARVIEVPTAIELVDDRLNWWVSYSQEIPVKSYFEPQPLFHKVALPPDVLTRFVRLRGAAPEEILGFAQKWGPLRGALGVWRGSVSDLLTIQDSDSDLEEDIKGINTEPVEHWWRLSTQAFSILNIASRLHQGKTGLVTDWDNIPCWPPNRNIAAPLKEELERWENKHGMSVPGQKWKLASVLNRWLRMSDVVFGLDWADPDLHPDREIRADFSVKSLLGSLSVQLVLSVAQSKGLAVCTSCGSPYIPKRRPSSKRRNFCQPCGKRKVSAKYASRDYRQRKSRGGSDGS